MRITESFPEVANLERYPETGIDVLVVGGGIGGMMAAMECYRKGHNVRVLEALHTLSHNNGGYLRLSAAPLQTLVSYPGMQAALQKLNFDPVVTMRTWEGEILMGPMDITGPNGVNAGMSVHRSSLVLTMYHYLLALGIEVLLNTKAEFFYENPKTGKGGCVTRLGEKYEADIVIAADGIGSKASSLVTGGKAIKAESSGYSVYRCTMPTEIGFKNPEIADFFKLPADNKGHTQMWFVEDETLVVFVNKDDIAFNIVHIDRLGASERWNQNRDKEHVFASLEEKPGWHPVVHALVDAAPPENVFDWRLMWRDPNSRWVSPHGHVCLLGDAAHTFLPMSGSGAGQSMEDGICLSTCLNLAGKSQIPLAARVYNKLRFERCACIQKVGFRNRNKWLKVDLEAVKKNPRPMAEIVPSWVNMHKPEEYVYDNYARCARHIQMGTPFENTNGPKGYKYKPWSMDEFMERDVPLDEGDWS